MHTREHEANAPGTAMTVYLVERELPRLTHEQLRATQQATRRTSERFCAEGLAVRYLRSVYVPGDGRCWCLFAAESAAVARDVNAVAGLPFTRIIEALDLTPVPP